MNWIRNIVLCLVTAATAVGFADTGSTATPTVVMPASSKAAADSNILSFPVPKVGFRIGGGEWNDFMIDAGMDVTFNVPIIPLPALRVDGEVWGDPGSLGQDRHGNAISVLGIQTFVAGYAGIGPSFYYTDDEGNHNSGFGVKLLFGVSLPHSTYAEAGMIIGPSTPPIFFTFGQRF